MTIADIKAFILMEYQDARAVESDGDMFLMHGADDKFPFATIITKDNEFDAASDLNRDGVFRLNMGIDRDSFTALFGDRHFKGIGGYLKSDIDFQALNVIFPHPMYGAMYWISVLNPDEAMFEVLKPYLSVAYHKR